MCVELQCGERWYLCYMILNYCLGWEEGAPSKDKGQGALTKARRKELLLRTRGKELLLRQGAEMENVTDPADTVCVKYFEVG